MRNIADAMGADAAAHVDLIDMVVSGPLRRVEALPGGGWVITPQTGRPLLLTDADQARAYITRTAEGGARDLSPVRPPAPLAPVAEGVPEGCGCAPAAPDDHLPFQARADLMQARAITAALGDLGVVPARRAAAWDETHQAAAVRVTSSHGLYALHIPPVHRQFAVYRNGRRDGVLPARRVPAYRDSMVATLLAAYLRDRAAL
ncbi:hypothetical protein [Streptomyces sp. NPDC001108]